MKRPWRRQEERLAKRRGGERQPASGAGPVRKEDVRDAIALAQCKSTTRGSILIRFDDLVKLSRHAAKEGRMPYMELLFARDNPIDNKRVYVVFEEEFKQYFPVQEDADGTSDKDHDTGAVELGGGTESSLS